MICLQLTFKHIHQKPPHNSRLLNIICHHSQQYSADMKPRVPLTEQRDRQTDRQTVPVTWFCSEYPLHRHMPAWHWATRTRAWTAGCISSSTGQTDRQTVPVTWFCSEYPLRRHMPAWHWATRTRAWTAGCISSSTTAHYNSINRPATTHWPNDWQTSYYTLAEWLTSYYTLAEWLTDQLLHTGRLIDRPATTHWPNDWQTNYYTLADWLTDQLLHTGRLIDRPATTHWPIDWLIDWLS